MNKLKTKRLRRRLLVVFLYSIRCRAKHKHALLFVYSQVVYSHVAPGKRHNNGHICGHVFGESHGVRVER